MSQREDPVRDLNNFLQGHPRGNWASKLSWVETQSGPQHQVTHNVTANFQGQNIGEGTGFAKTIAKAAAATQALDYLKLHYPYPPQ